MKIGRGMASSSGPGIMLAVVAARGSAETPPFQSDEPFRFFAAVSSSSTSRRPWQDGARPVRSGITSRTTSSVYEDGQPQTITYFSAERLPVSLGIVLDTSGSMVGDKIQSARRALDWFLYDLLDPEDEIFLYQFSDQPVLLQGWDEQSPNAFTPPGGFSCTGGTATGPRGRRGCLRWPEPGCHRKKALLVVSDGNDTSSQRTSIVALERQIIARARC